MSLASELAGDDALKLIQSRTSAYWDRALQTRLIASLTGIKAQNIASNNGDMVIDISGLSGDAAIFNASAVIDAAGTLGDNLGAVSAIAMHSALYSRALKNDEIATIPDSLGGQIRTYRGLAVIVDDSLPVDDGAYTSILFGPGAVGYAVAPPRIAAGTAVEVKESAGNGGGMQILHSRNNAVIHPLGYSWNEGTIEADSPSVADLALPAHWSRIVDRKAVPLAFLVSRVSAQDNGS